MTKNQENKNKENNNQENKNRETEVKQKASSGKKTVKKGGRRKFRRYS